MGFYALQIAFPYLQTGSDVIFQAKLRTERTPHLFKQPGKIDLLFFGNSKGLSGFVPRQFDSAMEASGRPTESYNLAMPAYPYFVDRLARILAASNVPKYILITVPWTPDEPRVDVFHFIRHDSQLMNELFPFRLLARDILMSIGSSIRSRSPIDYYETNRRNVERMIADRGYFFIRDESDFPSAQLPDNYTAATDRPTVVLGRTASTHEREFQKLNRMLESYHVTCLIVPTYWRVGQFAPPPSINQTLAAELAPYPEIKLIGPDYILLENRYFSDPRHLNSEGAHLYTKYLTGLVAPNLR